MARPPSENRRSIVDATLTLRLTQQDRRLLQDLVALQAAEMSETGMEVTAASYLRGLIRHEARLRGLIDSGSAAGERAARANAHGVETTKARRAS